MERTELQTHLRWDPRANRKPVVLVVEDDADSREALLALLSPHFEVVGASNGEDAVHAAQTTPPDVVLADFFLPGMDGLTTLEALREQPGMHAVPVVFLSGAGDESTVVRCLEEGAADFVAKPASSKELLARLNRAVRQRKAQEALETLAQTDGLTGLSNFRALSVRLEDEFRRADRYGYNVAVVMLDLDHLKTLNDRYGHDTGNRAILLLAADIRENLREVDFAARFGGDEFSVILPHQTSQEAAIFAERLRARVNGHCLEVAKGGERLKLSISVGVAAHMPSAPKPSVEALMQAADEALYEAKRQGRNRVRVFEADHDNSSASAARHA